MKTPNAMVRHERSWPRLPLGRIVAAGSALIIIYFALSGFHGVSQFFFLGFFGVLLAILVDVPTKALAERMPRGLALVLVTLALVGLCAGSSVVVAPRVSTQLAQLAHAVPRGVARAGELWTRIAPPAAGTWAAARDRLVAALPSLATRMVPFVNGTVSAVTGTLIVFAVGLFFAIDPHAELVGVSRLVPPRYEATYWTLVTRIGATLRRWLVGTIVTQALVATLTGVGLLIVGVSSWLALALVTFVTGFVPYVGSAFSGLLVLGAGLAVSPRIGLAAIVVFIIGQALHSVVIAPLVFRRTVQIPPALLLLSEIVMGASFGVLGVIGAHPLLAVAMVFIEFVYVEGRLGREPSARGRFSVAPDGDGRPRARRQGTKEAAMSNFVVVVVPDEAKAYEAMRALKELHADGTVTLFGAAVVERKADGKLDVKQAADRGPVGLGVGSLVGGLIGLFGGPVGAAAGFATGGILGSWRDYMHAGVGEDFAETIGRDLAPGKFAVIAEMTEDWIVPTDTRMEAVGGKVIREPRDEFIDDTIERRTDAFKSELDRRKAEHASAKAEKMGAKLQQRIEETQQDLQRTASKARQRLDEKKQEMNAKLDALREQAKKAKPEVRNQIEKRIDEIRADLEAREQKLNHAWEIAQEALSP